jgi:hypothetical protein
VSVAVAAAAAAAGCNLIVGVGDYAAGGSTGDDDSNLDSGSGSDDDSAAGADASGESGPDGSGESGPDGEAGVDAATPVDAGLDAIADVAIDGPGSCSPTLVASCPTGSVGYLCTGSDRPQQESDASLACQLAPGVGTGGPTAYCCVTSSCAPLTELDSGTYAGPFCDDGWLPYGCSSTDTPQQGAAPLACEVAPGGCFGSTDYCCITPTCAPNAALTCPGQTGYTCPGGDAPQNSDPTLQCIQASTNNYCCSSLPVTCSLNSSLTPACPPNQTGYSCTGSDYPGDDFPSVSACAGGSTGTGDGGSDYCCTASCFTNNDCAWNSYGTVCSYAGCVAPSGLVGDPCSTGPSGWAPCSDEDGGTATCNGTWCTQSCTTSDSCGTNSTGNSNVCVTTVGLCFPSCNQSADCAPYNDTFCVPAGPGVSVCAGSAGNVGGMIGDSCGSDTDCASGDAGANVTCDPNLNACTQPCASLADTSCGTNSLGNSNYCAPTPFGAGYECVPGCPPTGCSAYTQSYCGATPSTCTFSSDGTFAYCALGL